MFSLKLSSVLKSNNKLTSFIVRSSFSSSSSSSGNDKDSNGKDSKEIDKTTDKKPLKPSQKSLTVDPDKKQVKKPESLEGLSKYAILGPDGLAYDPVNDPEFTNDYRDYRYPQYFTKHLGPKRAIQIIKDDLSLLKKGRIHMTREELPPPRDVDVLIMGGGIMGVATAYFLKSQAPFSYNVAVLERDPTYTKASTTLSAGGIRQQFSTPENIQMSMFTADFLREYKKHLSINDCDPPDVCFTPQGYLTLADESQAEQMLENHKLQIELGAMVELYSTSRLREKFPFLNLNGVALGSYGVQNEGWFDPYALLVGLKAKAQMLGVEFVQGNIIDFNFRRRAGIVEEGSDDPYEQVNHAIYERPSGEVRQIQFGVGVVCTGYNSGEIAKLLGYGKKGGVRSIEFPVGPRKRYVYVINCKDGPGLDFPFLIDSTGEYCRREGLGGNYICGMSPTEEEEPDCGNLDVDYNFFEEKIHPLLANRVPAFEAIKVKGGWAGYYDYCTLDQNPIIGRDPYYQNLWWATGFSGHGIQMAPALGRGITEQIIYQEYKTIDLSCFGFHRVLMNRPLSTEIII